MDVHKLCHEREREDDVLTLEMDNGILPFK